MEEYDERAVVTWTVAMVCDMQKIGATEPSVQQLIFKIFVSV